VGSIAALKRVLGFVALILAVASFVGSGPTLLAAAIVCLALAELL
jgi:hypothetical protein